MRRCYSLLVLLLCGLSLSAQYNCTTVLPADLEAAFQQDAQQISLRHIYDQQLADTSTVNISTDLVQIPYAALAALYANPELPHWNAVFENYDIHTAESIPASQLQVRVDSSAQWVEEWLSDTSQPFATGTTIGELLAGFKFNLVEGPLWVNGSEPGVSDMVVTLSSRSQLNLKPLQRTLEVQPGIKNVQALAKIEAGYPHDITMDWFEDYVELIFSYGWDCDASGQCNNRHFWRYRVYADCQVEFIDDYGSTLQVFDLLSFLSTGIFPNPTSGEFSLVAAGPLDTDIQVLLYNPLGQIIHQEILRSNNGLIDLQFSLQDQPVGLYFLGLSAQGAVLTEKILKR